MESSAVKNHSDEDKRNDLVAIEPPDRLPLSKNEHAKIRIVNRSGRVFLYKVKTTRYESVMPNRTYGVVQPSSTANIKVAFKPGRNEKPFGKNDRLTLMLKAIPVSGLSLKKVWNDTGKTYRRVLRLVNEPIELSPTKPAEPVPAQQYYSKAKPSRLPKPVSACLSKKTKGQERLAVTT